MLMLCPIVIDRTRQVKSGTLLEVTGRWGPASGRDQTDVSNREWYLTGSDRTLGTMHPVIHCSASDHNLNVLMTVEIGRSAFEAEATWRASHDRTLGFYVRSP